MNLRDQLADVQAKLEQEKALGQRKDAEKIAILEAEEARLLEQIMHEGMTGSGSRETNNDCGLPFNFSEYFGVPSLNGMILSLYAAKDEQYNNTINNLKEELRGTKEEVVSLSYQSKELQDKLQQTAATKVQAEAERDDFEQRWNAACGELSEKDDEIRKHQEEVDRLKLHVDDLRKQLAAAPAPSLSRIDITATNINIEDFKRKLDEERARKPKVTNVRWEDDFKKTHYLAEDIDDTTIRIPYMELGKYDVLNAEQVLQFRAEREAQRNHADIALDAGHVLQISAPEIVTELQFQPGDANHNQPAAWGDGHPEAPPIEGSVQDTEDLSGPASRAELKALQERVAALENSIAKQAA